MGGGGGDFTGDCEGNTGGSGKLTGCGGCECLDGGGDLTMEVGRI